MKSLIDKAQRGDESARRELAARLRPRLVSMARHYARCWREDHEDLLGEGWFAVFTALAETDIEVGQPEHFLLKRARWRMLDYIKWVRRRRAGRDQGLPPPPEADIAPRVLHAAVMAQATEGLSGTQQVVLDRLLAGETWREVAAALGCSSANIAYHVRQIRQRCEHLVEGAAPAGAIR